MTADAAGLDFAALFSALPTAYLVMSPELVILDANPADLRLLGRTRAELVGRYVFDAFPPSPDTLDDDGGNPLQRSFERARDTGVPDPLPMFRYDVLDQTTGQVRRRTWSLTSVPVRDPGGTTRWVLQRVMDVTDYVADLVAGRARPGAPDGCDPWARVDELEADLFAGTRELRSALAAQEATACRLAALAEVAVQLGGVETVQEVTDVVAGTGLAALGAVGGALALREDSSSVVRLTVAGASADEAAASARALCSWVVQHDRPVALTGPEGARGWSAETGAEVELPGSATWLAVPVRGAGRVLGALLATWDRPRPPGDDEAQLVEALASQAGDAVRRIRGIAAERRAAASSRAVAETLQRSMLSAPAAPRGVQLAVRYLPASHAAQVGGDWYDAFLQADGAVNLVIGDVVGHDIHAAAAMGQLRSLLRGIVVAGSPGPTAALATLDTAIAQLDLRTYATVGLARLEQDPDDRCRGTTRLRWASAGHPAPVVVDSRGAAVPVPDPAGHLLLGVDAGCTRGDVVVTLDQGSTVLLFTDGLVERPGEDVARGVARLQDLLVELAGRDLEQLCDEVLHRLVDGHPADDVALVAARLHPGAGVRPA